MRTASERPIVARTVSLRGRKATTMDIFELRHRHGSRWQAHALLLIVVLASLAMMVLAGALVATGGAPLR